MVGLYNKMGKVVVVFVIDDVVEFDHKLSSSSLEQISSWKVIERSHLEVIKRTVLIRTIVNTMLKVIPIYFQKAITEEMRACTSGPLMFLFRTSINIW